MPAMWHVYRCIQEHLSLPPTPTFFDLYHRLRAKPIPFPQRQIQMETPCGRYTQSMRLNWSRRFVALAGWESGHLLVWKMRRLGWMVFPSCVSLILHQSGVFLISSLLFLPGSFFFLSYVGAGMTFQTAAAWWYLCYQRAGTGHPGFQAQNRLLSEQLEKLPLQVACGGITSIWDDLSVIEHACGPTARKAEVGGLLWVQDPSGLHSETLFQKAGQEERRKKNFK